MGGISVGGHKALYDSIHRRPALFSSSFLYPRHGQADPFIPLQLVKIRDAESTGMVDYC